MIQHIKAIYEGGVLRPLEPVALAEQEVVTLSIDAELQNDRGRDIDPTLEQSLHLVEQSGTLSFWDDASEDVYSLTDGEPIQ